MASLLKNLRQKRKDRIKAAPSIIVSAVFLYGVVFFEEDENMNKNKNDGYISRADVHNKVFECQLNELGDEIVKVEKMISETKFSRKKAELQAKLSDLNKQYVGFKKESRAKEYKRKADRIAELFPEGAFYIKEGKDIRNSYLTKEEAIIYAVLIALASMRGSWVNVWCSAEGIEPYASRGIVELYEYIQENIYMNAGITGWGQRPVIDQWLQTLDVCIDYTMSKRVCRITDKLEQMRKEGAALNHQINYGSMVCQDGGDTYYARAPYGPVPSAVPQKVDPMNYEHFGTEEQFFAGIDELTDRYFKQIQIVTKERLSDAIQIGKLAMSLAEDDSNDEASGDYEDTEVDPLPEYEQLKLAYIRYVKNNNDIVKAVLKEENITLEQAIEYLEYYPT